MMRQKKTNTNVITWAAPERQGAVFYPLSPGQPRGAVLLYTFFVLLLMTLMGAALMVNSNTELRISGSTAQGRDAFTKGDASARVALLLARPFLQPAAGDPFEYLNATKSGQAGQKPFEVILDPGLRSYTDLQQVGGSITETQIRERYLRVTGSDDDAHITLKYGDETVGTAVIGVAVNQPGEFVAGQPSPGSEASGGGGSIGDEPYSSNDSHIKVHFVISAQGRLPSEDNKSYLEEEQAGIHSIITSIFRELISQ